LNGHSIITYVTNTRNKVYVKQLNTARGYHTNKIRTKNSYDLEL